MIATRALLLILLTAPALAAGKSARIDDYATAFIAEQRIPGLSLAVVRDGKLVKAAGYGFANRELKPPAGPDDGLSVFVLCNIDRGDAVNPIATRVASFYVPGLSLEKH